MKAHFFSRKSSIREVIILFSILLLVILFDFVGWFSYLKTTSEKMMVPLYEFHVSLVKKIKSPYDYVLFSFNKSKYVKQLETKYTKSLAELSELDKLREENAELRKLIENRDIKLERTIVSSPIVSLAYPAVGAGSYDGVRENNMVLFNKMLVGTIDEVGDYESKVSLLSRPRKNKILAKTESGAEGVVDGDGKNILLTQVSRSAELVNGERVVAVGQEGVERNTFIGTIRKVENNPSAPTQTAIVVQEVTFYDAVILEIK